jgi:hypothetical protein
MEVRPKQLAAFYDGDLWRAHRDEANASITDSDNVLLLEPASPALRLADPPPRATVAHAESANALLVVTLYYTKPQQGRKFAAAFDRSLRPRAEAAGAHTVAAFVTSRRVNNYPRLPVRVGEHIYVWLARFATREAYAEYQMKLAADTHWTDTVWTFARAMLVRDPEVLRLAPTAGSRLLSD